MLARSTPPDDSRVRQRVVSADADAPAALLEQRRHIADRIFKAALLFNGALTVFWLAMLVTGTDAFFFGTYAVDRGTVVRVISGVLIFWVFWGGLWYAVKNALLKFVAGFSNEERRAAFSSRMSAPYDVNEIVARHSERRIRIIDMIGRRGRIITLAPVSFFYLYARIGIDRPDTFATAFTLDSLLDGVVATWMFLALYYRKGFLAAVVYGPQSRIMDGVLARANCLLITTLWLVFRFVMVPIGMQLATVFPSDQFAVVFALIWGSYIITDALAEIGGALFGRQKIRVWGVGDVNRKSVAGTVSGFTGGLIFCVVIVVANQLPAPWLVLSLIIAMSNTLLEFYSPRGTDDVFMATGNALICWAFGALVLY